MKRGPIPFGQGRYYKPVAKRVVGVDPPATTGATAASTGFAYPTGTGTAASTGFDPTASAYLEPRFVGGRKI